MSEKSVELVRRKLDVMESAKEIKSFACEPNAEIYADGSGDILLYHSSYVGGPELGEMLKFAEEHGGELYFIVEERSGISPEIAVWFGFKHEETDEEE